MPEKPKFIITVFDDPYHGTGRSERVELEATTENREAIRAYQRNPTRRNLRRLIGPTEELFNDGWTVGIKPPA
jgi:hypothetical protein